jgi:glycosyltransferase involved in cell wall biosynthesis
MSWLHLTRDFPPATNGGLSTVVGDLVQTLATTGIPQRTLSLDAWRPGSRSASTGPPRPDDPVFRARQIPPDPWLQPWLQQSPPDLIWVHDPLVWDAVHAHLPDRPVVALTHVAFQAMDRLRGLPTPTRSAAAEARLHRAAAAVVVPSPVCADAMQDAGFGHRLHLIPWACAPMDRANVPSTRLPGARWLVAGRWGDIKGTDTLIELLGHLTDAPEPGLVLGGLPENPRAHRRWADALEVAARQAGVPLSILPWQDRATVRGLLAEHPVVVQPSRFETFGMTTWEALHAGCPVVGTRTGILASLQPTVPVGDAEGLAACLQAHWRGELSSTPPPARTLLEVRDALVDLAHRLPAGGQPS